jgi:uncharacterized protein with NAD-binding domain and iron-sulfur cluster
MIRKGPGAPRFGNGPQARDFLSVPPRDPSDGTPAIEGIVTVAAAQQDTSRRIEALRMDGLSSSPDPRIPGKHALNPPIVTVFGAGVAGMTAAHELVDRGFLVQVVEDAEDPYCPGRPRVGGMAANQPARVRANVEDLHRELMVIALTPRVDGEPPEETQRRKVAAWLLKVFAFNRSRWIRTEVPERLNGCMFTLGDEPGCQRFQAALIDNLRRARERYKRRWLWDLTVRGAKLGMVVPRDRSVDWENDARQALDALAQQDAFHIAQSILTYRRAANIPGDDLPDIGELAAVARGPVDIVTSSLEREFLCFRLVPYARAGFENAAARARDLYEYWAGVFADDPVLRHCCVSGQEPPEARVEGAGRAVPRGRDGMPIAVETAPAPPEFPFVAWLEIEIIEQRLPGEHGYRFFPSFYRHLDDTMGRIPLYMDDVPTGRTVRDNLRPTVFQGIGLSPDDRDAIVAKRVNPRRAKLEGDDHRQRDNRYPDFSDPVREPCRVPMSGSVVELNRARPRSLEQLRDCTDRFVKRLGGTERDALILLAKLVRYLTSSPDRRHEKYEKQTWENFLEVENFSENMRLQIMSAAQALLAFSAAQADARTYGNIAIQMLLDELRDGTRVDRTLNGPTSDAWLEPWRDHLERQGVRFFRGRIEKLEIHGDEVVPKLAIDFKNRISPQAVPLLSHELREPALQPDFYVLALNIEQSRRLVDGLVDEHPELLGRAADGTIPLVDEAPDFAGLRSFGATVDEEGALVEMTGVQYFFDARTDIGRGHMYFPFSPWGLSSISQTEFWSARGGFADGYFGLLSVDICTTGRPPGELIRTPADARAFSDVLRPRDSDGDRDYRCLDAAQTTLEQIRSRLAEAEKMSAPRCFHLDDNLFIQEEERRTRFLASLKGLDATRPGRRRERVGEEEIPCVGSREIRYQLNFKRWVLAGTYMATHTRMTTMEAANESARHAVGAILDRLQKPDDAANLGLEYATHAYQLENLANTTYNWASGKRAYEPPETWNPEDDEIDDLDLFRRVDRRLMELKLPHFMDIINFDRKLIHALDAVDIYGEEKPLSQLFGAAAASLDALLTKELGQGYAGLEEARWKEAQGLRDTARFTDMAPLNARWKEFLDVFANLRRPPVNRAP